MPTTNRTPTLAEVIRNALDRRLMDVYVSMPGSIQSYNPVNQTATVIPLLRKLEPGRDGIDPVIPLPALQGVPVMFFGSGTWRITVPVTGSADPARADQCLLVWADRGLDRWKGTPPGNYDATHTIDPGSFNLHHLTDAVAILGLVSPAAPRAATANDRMSLGSDGGAVVEVLNSRVNLGAGASQALVLGGQYQAHMTALATALQALQTAITPLMLPPAAAAAKAAALAAYNAATQLSADISATSFTVP